MRFHHSCSWARWCRTRMVLQKQANKKPGAATLKSPFSSPPSNDTRRVACNSPASLWTQGRLAKVPSPGSGLGGATVTPEGVLGRERGAQRAPSPPSSNLGAEGPGAGPGPARFARVYQTLFIGAPRWEPPLSPGGYMISGSRPAVVSEQEQFTLGPQLAASAPP